MPQMPVTLVVALLLTLLVVRSVVDPRHRLGPFATAALSLYALQCVPLGLRWGYGIMLEWPVQAALAALIPGFTWLTLRRLVGSAAARSGRLEIGVHIAPSIVVFSSPLLPLPVLDYLIVALFLGYGIALLSLALTREIACVDRIPFQGFARAKAAFVASGLVLVGSALVEVAVIWDMSNNAGAFSGDIVAYAQLLLLPVLSLSVVMVGALQGRAATAEADGEDLPAHAAALSAATDPSDPEIERQHADVVRALDAVMAERHLYRDPDLSLERLARKVRIPARQISSAINAHRAMNVSQYVNKFRVHEACDLLRDESLPITAVIFDVGFQTKSNFNREFRRLIGMSPSEWRRAAAGGGGEAASTARAKPGIHAGLAFQDAPRMR